MSADFLVYWHNYWQQLNSQLDKTDKLRCLSVKNDDYQNRQKLKVGNTVWVIIQNNDPKAEDNWILLQRFLIYEIDQTGNTLCFQEDENITFAIGSQWQAYFIYTWRQLEIIQNKTFKLFNVG